MLNPRLKKRTKNGKEPIRRSVSVSVFERLRRIFHHRAYRGMTYIIARTMKHTVLNGDWHDQIWCGLDSMHVASSISMPSKNFWNSNRNPNATLSRPTFNFQNLLSIIFNRYEEYVSNWYVWIVKFRTISEVGHIKVLLYVFCRPLTGIFLFLEESLFIWISYLHEGREVASETSSWDYYRLSLMDFRIQRLINK